MYLLTAALIYMMYSAEAGHGPLMESLVTDEQEKFGQNQPIIDVGRREISALYPGLQGFRLKRVYYKNNLEFLFIQDSLINSFHPTQKVCGIGTFYLVLQKIPQR